MISMVLVPKYPVYPIRMQKVFPNSYPLFPRFRLLVGNSNDKLISIMAAEFPNHFENPSRAAVGTNVLHF